MNVGIPKDTVLIFNLKEKPIPEGWTILPDVVVAKKL